MGTEGRDPFTFTVYRSGVTTLPLDVDVRYSGTATNSSDYDAIGVRIPAGQSSVDVTIMPLSDPFIEPPESVILTIQPSTAYAVGAPSSATAFIVDPVDGPTLSPIGLAVAVALIALA
jgi:hypothetical protein